MAPGGSILSDWNSMQQYETANSWLNGSPGWPSPGHHSWSTSDVAYPGPPLHTWTTTTTAYQPPPPGSPESDTTITTTTTEYVDVGSVITKTVPTISTKISITTTYVISTTRLPPVLQYTTLTTTLSGSVIRSVSTVTQPGTTSVVTRTLQPVTNTLQPETDTVTLQPDTETVTLQPVTDTITSTDIQITTVTVTHEEKVTFKVIPVSNGSVITVVPANPTISNVVTGPPCAGPAVDYFPAVSWYVYAPPSPGIPPLATHQPIVFPNGETSTSIYCDTQVFNSYLRTHFYDCKLGRGPYQTLDQDCNIVVGPVFTGNGPTPTGPGITITQSGPYGTVLDLGTSISANNVPVTGAAGQIVCVSTTTTVLPTPLIYSGLVTVVPSFYQTVQLAKRQVSSVSGTSKLIVPGLPPIAPKAFGQSRAVVTASSGNTISAPGALTTTKAPIPYSKTAGTALPDSSPVTTSTSHTVTTQIPSPTSTTSSSSTSTSPPTTSHNPATTSSAVTTSSLAPPQSPTITGLSQRIYTTEVCQQVTYTGHTGYIVPELSIAANNTTVTETLSGGSVSTGSASSTSSVSPAGNTASNSAPSWPLYLGTAMALVSLELLML